MNTAIVKVQEISHLLIVRTLEQVRDWSLAYGPKILLSLLILFIGWIGALLVKKAVSKLLKAFGFDVVSERAGLKQFLDRGGIHANPSALIGLGFYWLILFSALLMILNTLNLDVASQLVRQIALYIPKIIMAVLLLSLGIFLAQFVAELVERSSRIASIPLPAALGRVARYGIIGIATLSALEYLDLAPNVLVESIVVLFATGVLVGSLVVLIGGRDILVSVMAGTVLKQDYAKGDHISFDSVAGEIESIDLVNTKIRVNGHQVIVPNAEMGRKIIKRLPASEKERLNG